MTDDLTRVFRSTIDEHVSGIEHTFRPAAGVAVTVQQVVTRRRRNRTTLAGAALAVTLVAGVAGVIQVGVGPDDGAASIAARLTLDEQTAPFWYARSVQKTEDTSWTYETWFGRYSSGRDLRYEVATGAQAQGVDQPPATWTLNHTTQATWDQLIALPTDPVKLETILRQQTPEQQAASGGRDISVVSAGDAAIFEVLGTLAQSPAPRALRLAVYEMATTLPDVQQLGIVTDNAGRPGQLLRGRGGRSVVEFVVDPGDGRVLEKREAVNCPKAPCEITYTLTYLEQGPVPDLQSRLTALPFPEPSPDPLPTSSPSAITDPLASSSPERSLSSSPSASAEPSGSAAPSP